jgi:hypothetical protein
VVFLLTEVIVDSSDAEQNTNNSSVRYEASYHCFMMGLNINVLLTCYSFISCLNAAQELYDLILI